MQDGVESQTLILETKYQGRKDQMPGTGNGQKFRQALDNAQEYNMQKFHIKMHSHTVVNAGLMYTGNNLAKVDVRRNLRFFNHNSVEKLNIRYKLLKFLPIEYNL